MRVDPHPPPFVAPPVSVVMPVHNALPYLHESIASILAQRFADFEFVILDDGSTDGSGAALREWARRDERIRLVASPRQLGLAGSANRVVAEARAPLVARMDADDVAHPERLARQLAVLRAHPDVQLVGTLWDGIDARGRRVRPPDRWRLARPSRFPPFAHGSIMFRRAAFERIGGYRAACDFWEDQDFYQRMVATGRVFVLPEILYHYLLHLDNSRLTICPERVERALSLMHRCLVQERAGSDYDALLAAVADGQGGPERFPPMVFFSLGAARLWAGGHPGVLRALLRRGALAPDRATALVLAWAVWGSVSPASLRLALRSLITLRDWAASRRLQAGRPYEWRFG